MADRPRRWWLAALFSVFVPSLAQVYNGQPRKAAWFVVLTFAVLAAFAILANTIPFMVAMVATLVAALVVWPWALVDGIAQAKRQGTSYELRRYNRVIVYAGYVLVLMIGSEVVKAVIKEHHVQAFRIPSRSMSPTLLPGDYVFVDKRASARSPARGDIAVFQYPRDPRLQYLDRVVGQGGETLELHDKTLLIGGEPVAEPFAVHLDSDVRPAGYDPRDNLGPTTIPEGAYFVMGDNRDNSNDSRFWGPLEGRHVIGRVRGIYFSWDPEKKAVRWERIGKLVK
jgi:signal peptidase I